MDLLLVVAEGGELSLVEGGHELSHGVAVPVGEGDRDGLLLRVPPRLRQPRPQPRGGVAEDELVGGHGLPVTADQPHVHQVARGQEGQHGRGQPQPPFRKLWRSVRLFGIMIHTQIIIFSIYIILIINAYFFYCYFAILFNRYDMISDSICLIQRLVGIVKLISQRKSVVFSKQMRSRIIIIFTSICPHFNGNVIEGKVSESLIIVTRCIITICMDHYSLGKVLIVTNLIRF